MTIEQTTGEWLLATFGPGEPRSIDLGSEHWAKPWVYEQGEPWGGFRLLHPKGPSNTGAYADSDYCLGSVAFDIPEAITHNHKGPLWAVQSIDPLTISPSIACGCGDHGFIRDGKWVSA